jgi:hypothetical protein
MLQQTSCRKWKRRDQSFYTFYRNIGTNITKRKPPGYWQDISNQRLFFDQLSQELSIQKPSDWNEISAKTVLQKGGQFLNNFYNGSLRKGTIFYSRFKCQVVDRRSKEIVLEILEEFMRDCIGDSIATL